MRTLLGVVYRTIKYICYTNKSKIEMKNKVGVTRRGCLCRTVTSILIWYPAQILSHRTLSSLSCRVSAGQKALPTYWHRIVPLAQALVSHKL